MDHFDETRDLVRTLWPALYVALTFLGMVLCRCALIGVLHLLGCSG